jgi:1,4-alpha-glucan branching enzyme
VAPPPNPLPKRMHAGPIVFAGRFTGSKGIALLGAIGHRLLKDYRCRFVLAGGHGDDLGHRIVTELAAAFPRTCQAVGWLSRDATDELFSRAGVVVVPSRYEPFGMVALEAMRVGAPVLAAGVGGLLDAVGPGSGGRLVHSRDPERWCRAILEILDSPSLQSELHAAGPDYVTRWYHPRRLAERLSEQVYGALQ